MSESAARPSREYVLTHTDMERRRLALQASIINPFTNRFLRDTGIYGGMHVLDFGCGVGDVSLAVGRLVGAHGSVTWVDIDLKKPRKRDPQMRKATVPLFEITQTTKTQCGDLGCYGER